MKTPLVPSDLYALVNVADPVLAPDARSVYFRRITLDRATDSTRSALWRADRDGTVRPFTAGINDRLPRLSPDGSALAFAGDREDATRLMLINTGGGEVCPVGPAFAKITALAWSPDGTQVALVATADHDPQTARIYHDGASGARHIRALPFKSDADGLLDGVRRHLYVLNVHNQSCEQLTKGDFDVAGPAWSPDGARIAFSAAIGRPEWSFTTDIHTVERATREVRTLTAGNGPMANPSWSHDGRTLAFSGHLHGDDAGGRFNLELFVVEDGGAPRSLSAGLDRTVGDAIVNDLRSHGDSVPVWSTDDREIVVQISDEGACGLRAFARDGSGERLIAGGEREIFAFSAVGAAIAFAYTTPLVPARIALLDENGIETDLTADNAWLAQRSIVAPRRFRPTSDDGTLLDGWTLVPEGQSQSGPLPLVLEVHGGPHAAYGFSFFFEFQMLAGTGCAVAYGNPRGGQSYGHAYADAITGDWGGIDAADVERILDGALGQAEIDPARIGVAGGSYGGFMTTWLLGHRDRFAAGISMRAVNDFVSEVGASDLGWFLEREIVAPPVLADAGRVLFDASPLRAASHIDVPLLVEHSERDYRCPIDQGEQLFTLLRRLGKKNVEFVRFSGDGHELSRAGKPRNRVLRLRAIAHWLIRHLRPADASPVPDEAGALFRPLATETEPA